MTWTPTPTGYTGTGFAVGTVHLVRRGRVWFLKAGGVEHRLGPRATFDTAEALLG